MTTGTTSSQNISLPADGQGASWPLRAWGLTLLGGLGGLAVFFLLRPDLAAYAGEAAAVRLALATFIGVAALAFGFVVERGRIRSSLIFCGAAGLVVAAATYWNGPFGTRGYGEPWRIVCAALTVGIGAPLFQALRDRQPGAPLSYTHVHGRAWSNTVLWCAIWVFVGIVWLMAWLLSALFNLIGLGLLEDLLEKEWMALALTGTALGAATGVLRDRDAILGMVQRVVTTVLSVLAPVLATGLLLFLAALPFTGLAPLWEATRSTTPILLTCVIGALCLANAVIGGDPEQEARHPVLRVSVFALALAILPLGVIAAISTGMRVNQHGLTPDRLWALVFTGIACAYGLAYLAALGFGRRNAATLIRTANLKMALGLCTFALLLSTPLVNFGALSARNQVARLNSGAVSPETFDWQALRFDFGPAGVAALRRLAAEGETPAIRHAASDALQRETRWLFAERPLAEIRADRLTVLPRPTPLPPELYRQLSGFDACGDQPHCVIVHEAGSDEAIIVTQFDVNVWRRHGATWSTAPNPAPERGAAEQKRREAGLASGQVEVRTITRRQIYVAGEPVGQPFD